MTTIKSEFQQKYSLSPKKLTKKMIGSATGGFFLSLALAGFGVVAYLAAIDSHAPFMDGLVLMLGWFAVIFCIHFLSYRLYWKSYINSYTYNCENGFITIKKGVFMPTEIHVQFQKIQDVYVDQDLMDRVMGLYDVHIASATASSGIEAHIDGVDFATAEALKNFLLSAIRGGSTPDTNTSGTQAASTGQNNNSNTPTSVKFSVPSGISEKAFPISSGWVTLEIVKAFFISILYTFVIGRFFLRGKYDTSLAEDVGLAHNNTGMYLIVIFILIFVFSVIKTIVWKKNYKFEMLPDYLFVRAGFISMQEQHIPYDRIQDVIVNQTFLERMFGLSSVFIQNAVVIQTKKGSGSGGMAIPGQTIENANKLSEVVRNILTSTKNQQTGL